MFARIVCGTCGARTRVVDLGERFPLAAAPHNSGAGLVRRRIETIAFGGSQVGHHIEHANAVSEFAAGAALARMGLATTSRTRGEVGAFAVLLCETQTMVRAWPGSTRLQTIELLFDAGDPNPLAQAVSAR